MKNILIVSDVAPPQVNGVLRTLENTTRILRERGHKVTILSPNDFRSVPMPFYPEIRFALPPFRMQKRIVGYDAVHIATEGALGLAASQAACYLNIPYTTAYHTNFPMYLQRYWKIPESLTYRYMRWFHKTSHKVMTPTHSMVNLLTSKGIKNVVHWGRGVDKEIFHPKSVPNIDHEIGPRPYFINVGRVSKEKNIEAFLNLDLVGTKIIIGDGPQRKDLEKRFPTVKFVGNQFGAQLADWYNRADVFVFPSKSDTYGLVIAEAISCGCPVAAYPVAGPIDIVEQGLTGHLDDNLGHAAYQALMLSSHARANVERDFLWETATDQFFQNLCFV